MSVPRSWPVWSSLYSVPKILIDEKKIVFWNFCCQRTNFSQPLFFGITPVVFFTYCYLFYSQSYYYCVGSFILLHDHKKHTLSDNIWVDKIKFAFGTIHLYLLALKWFERFDLCESLLITFKTEFQKMSLHWPLFLWPIRTVELIEIHWISW